MNIEDVITRGILKAGSRTLEARKAFYYLINNQKFNSLTEEQMESILDKVNFLIFRKGVKYRKAIKQVF